MFESSFLFLRDTLLLLSIFLFTETLFDTLLELMFVVSIVCFASLVLLCSNGEIKILSELLGIIFLLSNLTIEGTFLEVIAKSFIFILSVLF